LTKRYELRLNDNSYCSSALVRQNGAVRRHGSLVRPGTSGTVWRDGGHPRWVPMLGVRPLRGNTHDPVQRRGLTCRPGDSSPGQAVRPESPPRGSGARALRRGSSFRATYRAGNLYHETVIPSLNKCPFLSLSILLSVCLPAYLDRVEIVTGEWPCGVRPEHMMLECRDYIRLQRLLLILQIAQD
jgi:hypothetical protein